MSKASRVYPTDLLGLSRLAIDGTLRLTDLIEIMHHNITAGPGIFGTPEPGATSGITGLVYNAVRAVTGLVGTEIDTILTPLIPMLGDRRPTPERDAVLSALNGVIGDYLAATHNPLAITMRFRRKGEPLTLETPALGAAIPHPSRKLVVLVHGLCMSDRQWTRKGHNHGTALARDLGYTPIDLHYNGGLHISTNGRAFAALIEDLLDQWPVPLEEFSIVAHSLGGLVARSAYHYGAAAGYRWPRRLGRLIFLGTPHHGALLERVGNWVDFILEQNPCTSPFARLGKIRSAGITDLRYGNLLDEDWEGRDRFDHSGDLRRPVPLPANVQCCAIAGTTERQHAGLSCGLPGDGLVSVSSALGRHHEPGRSLAIADTRQWIGYGMNHLDLLNRPAVYRKILHWLTGN